MVMRALTTNGDAALQTLQKFSFMQIVFEKYTAGKLNARTIPRTIARAALVSAIPEMEFEIPIIRDNPFQNIAQGNNTRLTGNACAEKWR